MSSAAQLVGISGTLGRWLASKKGSPTYLMSMRPVDVRVVSRYGKNAHSVRDQEYYYCPKLTVMSVPGADGVLGRVTQKNSLQMGQNCTTYPLTLTIRDHHSRRAGPHWVTFLPSTSSQKLTSAMVAPTTDTSISSVGVERK